MEFKPKDWVLVRDDDEDSWKLDVFSHKDGGYFRCVSCMWLQCIPFEGNEHLLGTSDSPEEKKTGGWKVGDKVEVEYDTDKKWYGGEIVRINLSNRSWVDSEVMPYYVRSECFKYNDGCAWCAARQLREPVEKPEEEEFKFGDWVEVLKDGEWTVGIVTEVDEDDEFATYHVNFPDDDGWCSKSKVRKHEKG